MQAGHILLCAAETHAAVLYRLFYVAGAQIDSIPAGGLVIASPYQLEYLPDADATGTDTLRYKIAITGEEVEGWAFVTVVPVTDAPRITTPVENPRTVDHVLLEINSLSINEVRARSVA